ncbi:glutamine dumper 2-like protein [Tanacetum coccineum]|uniref:Glutamine dumper 2-like protein n=1 Tax=Tanacetum coccineum TaxID=301880 RepID=A0ABQ4XGU6_9ASTR
METQGSSSTSWRFDSRVTYLFGGIGAMLVLIIVALLMLTCFQYRQGNATNRSDSDSDSDHDHKAISHVCKDEANVTPKIAVINPGEEIPTYLAAPL